jgi:hypothetical protein
MRSVLALLAVACACACAAPNTPATPDQLPPGSIRITGAVTRFAIEGEFWAIRGDDGTVYDPIRPLAAEFLVEGRRVAAVVRIRTDLAGIHMVGPLVEVISINRL